jgi:hypothetical protein
MEILTALLQCDQQLHIQKGKFIAEKPWRLGKMQKIDINREIWSSQDSKDDNVVLPGRDTM